MWAQFFNGLRGGPLAFLVGILVFRWAKGELVLGIFTSIAGVLGLATSYWAGRVIKPANRAQIFRYGVWLLTASTGILALGRGALGLIAFGLVESLSLPWFGIPYNAFQFAVMDKDDNIDKDRAEYITARELPLNLGRIISTGVFLYLVVGPGLTDAQLSWYLVGLAAAQFAIGILLQGPMQTVEDGPPK